MKRKQLCVDRWARFVPSKETIESNSQRVFFFHIHHVLYFVLRVITFAKVLHNHVEAKLHSKHINFKKHNEITVVILGHEDFYNDILYTVLVCVRYLYITLYILISFFWGKSGTISDFNTAKYYTQLSVNSLSNWELNWLRITAATTISNKPQSTENLSNALPLTCFFAIRVRSSLNPSLQYLEILFLHKNLSLLLITPTETHPQMQLPCLHLANSIDSLFYVN